MHIIFKDANGNSCKQMDSVVCDSEYWVYINLVPRACAVRTRLGLYCFIFLQSSACPPPPPPPRARNVSKILEFMER